jgi:uncharacterized protein (TIGR03790 family)
MPWILLLGLLCAAFPCRLRAGAEREPGSSVVVVYNSRMPESKEVAEYYARRRQVPPAHLIGLELPTGETISREDYIQQILHPLLERMSQAGIVLLGNAGDLRVVASRVRYAVLCYGVPVKVLNDPNLKEPGTESMPPELHRTDCSVDAQLALLPFADKAPWTGSIPNRFYGVTNSIYIHPTNGLIMVTRLDGPSPAIARGLVDKAMEAETNGLWGRAYFDARGLTNGPYLQGDSWIRTSAQVMTRLGFETTLDNHEPTFSAGFPMSHIAFYAGWYDQNISGPFARPQVEFMPGAFAYHLHSFSAQELRTPSAHWVGPLLAKGVTATIGFVEEPYLAATLDVGSFVGRFVFFSNSLGEAAYASHRALSWQTLVVGDPLYRPFWQATDELERQLKERGSPLAAWAALMEANQNQAVGADAATVIRFLQKSDQRRSPILQEKVADLFMEQKRFSLAADTYEEVLKTTTSPGQRLRVRLALAEARLVYGPDQKAWELYQQILKEDPEYPDRALIYPKMITLARRLGKKADEDRLAAELTRLTGAAAGGGATSPPPAK